MPERRCCAECFGDSGLRDSIIPTLSNEQGVCDYCGAVSMTLVAPALLRQWFELLMEAYDPSPGGQPLVDCLRRDWRLFESPAMDDPHAMALLADILNDGDAIGRTFAVASPAASDGLDRWDELRDELMHRNRWFLDVPIDLDRLRQLLDMLIAPEGDLPSLWFRARLFDGMPFKISEMGPPPLRLASHGRANPAGIPYLYLGSTAATAVAEVRPQTGETVCVGEFMLGKVRAVDLRAPRLRVSPFILSDSTDISRLLSDLPLLERLGEELTRPILPKSAAFEYTPSQYLCEFIKRGGFDGVVYRSSVSKDINLALFDPARATGVAVRVVRVERVSVDFCQLGGI